MSGAVPVSRFLFKEEWKVLSEVMRSVPMIGEEFSAATDLITYIKQEPATLVISCLKSKDDLVQLATLMKLQKSQLKEAIVKVVVINFSGDKQFEKAIQKLGILDIVEPEINTKGLKFKIDFWMKSINAQIKKQGGMELIKKKMKSEDGGAGAEEEKKSVDAPQSVPSLDCEDDIWLLKNPVTDCKKVLGKWLIKLMGPGPYVGQWTELENKPNVWRFEIKSDNKDIFLPGEGSWYFSGDQKPDFVWKDNLWLITGTNFELFHRDKSNQNMVRLKLKDKQLTLAKNSDYATTKEKIIIESFDKELVFKGEGRAEESKDVLENDNVIDKNLEGKGKTDNIEQKDLSGKAKAEEKKGGHLKGQTKGEGQQAGSDQLEQKGETSKESGYWDGKNSKEERKKDLTAPGQEKAKEGALLEQENINREHKTHYKGHNEAEKFEANDKKNNQYKKDGNGNAPLSDKMEGPGSEKHRDGAELGLENINQEHKTHYEGHNEAEQFEANDKKNNQYSKSDFKEKPIEDLKSPGLGNPKEGKLLDMEKTDNEHQTHYKNKDPNQKQDPKEANAKEAGEKKSPDQKPSQDLAGKGQTDKLAAHYKSGSGVKKENEETDKDENNGKENSQDKKGSSKEKSAAEKQQKSNNAKDSADDSSEDNDAYSGDAGSTDKMSTHYKSKTSDTEEAEKKKTNKNQVAAKKSEESDDGSAQENSHPANKVGRSLAQYKSKKSSDQKKEDSAKDAQGEGDGQSEASDQRASKKDNDKNNGNSSELDGSKDSDNNPIDVGDFADNVVPIGNARNDKKSIASLQRELPEDLKEASQDAKLESKITSDGKEINCDLQDYFDQTFMFSSDKEMKESETIKLDLKFNYLNKVTNLSLEGLVGTIEKDADGKFQLTVQVDESSKDQIDKFMKVYEKRQKNVNVFFKNAKGY